MSLIQIPDFLAQKSAIELPDFLNTRCTKCQVNCQPHSQCGTCEYCERTCQKTCQNENKCTGCQVTCEKPCEKANQCTGCQTMCQEKCQDYCQLNSQGCGLKCEKNCQIACEKTYQSPECATTCERNCEGNCQNACQTQSQTCSWLCMLCETKCEKSCQNACQKSTQCVNFECSNCERNAQGCIATCQKNCQTTCELACQSTCQLACQDTCQLACQQACQLACQNCQSACEKVSQHVHNYIARYEQRSGDDTYHRSYQICGCGTVIDDKLEKHDFGGDYYHDGYAVEKCSKCYYIKKARGINDFEWDHLKNSDTMDVVITASEWNRYLDLLSYKLKSANRNSDVSAMRVTACETLITAEKFNLVIDKLNEMKAPNVPNKISVETLVLPNAHLNGIKNSLNQKRVFV